MGLRRAWHQPLGQTPQGGPEKHHGGQRNDQHRQPKQTVRFTSSTRRARQRTLWHACGQLRALLVRHRTVQHRGARKQVEQGFRIDFQCLAATPQQRTAESVVGQRRPITCLQRSDFCRGHLELCGKLFDIAPGSHARLAQGSPRLGTAGNQFRSGFSHTESVVQQGGIIKLPLLRGDGFTRVWKALYELIGPQRSVHRITRLAGNQNADPKRLGAGVLTTVDAGNVEQRFLGLAHAVEHDSQIGGQRRIARIEREALFERAFRCSQITSAVLAHTQRQISAHRITVILDGQGLVELNERVRIATLLTKEPAIVVQRIGIVRREPQRLAVIGLGLGGVVQRGIDERAHGVGGHEIRFLCQRLVHLFERHGELPALVVALGEFQTQLNTLENIGLLGAQSRARAHLCRTLRLRGAAAEQRGACHQQTEYGYPPSRNVGPRTKIQEHGQSLPQ